MESSKATAKHIRQVAGNLPAAQIQLMHHQCTELLTGNYMKWKMTKQKLQNHRCMEHHTSRKPFDLWKPEIQSDRCIRCGNTIHTKGLQCSERKFQCKVCHQFGHFTTVCYQKNQQTSNSFKPRKPKAHQLCTGALYTHQHGDNNVSDESDTVESFCLQMKVQKKTQFSHPQVPKPEYLMADLVYHLQMHHR